MWGDGLPEHGHFRDLVYNTTAEVLIAAFHCYKPVPGANSIPFGQLYYRHKSSAAAGDDRDPTRKALVFESESA
jgi:hypothetical protein